MNKILDYNTDKKKKKKPSGSDKVVRLFAIIIIIFAICLIGSGAYKYIIRKNASKPTDVAKPVIEVTQDGSTAVIKVTHTKALEKIVYSFNNGRETTIKTTGGNEASEIIPLPSGENTLLVKVTDVDNVEATFEQTFVSESGEDIINPVISLNVSAETKKLVITATDETAIDFITYRWNTDEEVTVKADEENQTKIEVEIDILRGSNDLTVVAVDKANNTTTESKSYTGLTKPEVSIILANDKKSAEVVIKHDGGIKSVLFNINGQELTPEVPEGNPTELSYPIENLPTGTYQFKVKATSVDDTVAEDEITIENEETVLTPEPGNGTEAISCNIENAGDGENANVTIHAEAGVEKVVLEVAGQSYDVYSYDGTTLYDLSFQVGMLSGNNQYKVTVTAIGGQIEEYTQELSK